MEIELNSYELLIHEVPLLIMEEYTQYGKRQNESGGIILGKIVSDQINILRLSIPTSLDKSSRYNFERSKTGAQIIIDYEFKNSHGQTIYLGEWHTHPEEYPTPSKQDIRMIKEQYSQNKLNVPFVILMIKGTKGIFIGIIDEEGFHKHNLTIK